MQAVVKDREECHQSVLTFALGCTSLPKIVKEYEGKKLAGSPKEPFPQFWLRAAVLPWDLFGGWGGQLGGVA